MNIGIDAFLHFVVGQTMGNVFQAIGLSVEHNVVLSSVVFIAKEATDPIFSNSDLLFDYLGLLNALL